MATKLDREWVKQGVQASLTVAEHMNALVLEVERLEALEAQKEEALLAARGVLQQIVRVAPGYDWNADPQSLTETIGNLHSAIDQAMTGTAVPNG